jgi:cysteine-rich repeat protein
MVVSGDGCNATCSGIESFWTCTVDAGTGGSVCEQCGDGEVAGSEMCDDGTNCLDGSDCTVGGTACGDGSTCQPRGGDGCRSVCLPENGWACPPTGGECQECGNGVIAPGFEDCDDNNTQPNDGCSSSCRLELGWACSPNMSGVSVCGRCGDGAIQTTTAKCAMTAAAAPGPTPLAKWAM